MWAYGNTGQAWLAADFMRIDCVWRIVECPPLAGVGRSASLPRPSSLRPPFPPQPQPPKADRSVLCAPPSELLSRILCLLPSAADVLNLRIASRVAAAQPLPQAFGRPACASTPLSVVGAARLGPGRRRGGRLGVQGAQGTQG